MKSELLLGILYLLTIVAIAWIITLAFDVIEIENSLLTGRLRVKMSKNPAWNGRVPMALEGKLSKWVQL